MDQFAMETQWMRASRVLDFAAIAEKEMERGEAPSEMFRVLQPPESILQLDPKVYRKHCRELIKRYHQGKRLDTATKAEVLGALSYTSLQGMLDHRGRLVFERIFVSFFGEENRVKSGNVLPTLEQYPGEYREALYEMRRSLPTGRPARLDDGKKRKKGRKRG